jgi:uncharacterized membrane protein YcaP (DUF421 family)
LWWSLAQVLTDQSLGELMQHVPILFWRTIVTFSAVLMVVRWTGKRSISNLAPFDLAMVIMVGEVAAIPVADLSVDLLHGALPILLIGGLHVLMTTINLYSKSFEELTEGHPTLLVKDGKVLKQNLIRERVSMADLMTALRHKEVRELDHVQEAWMEHAGGVSVIRKPGLESVTPVQLEAAIERIVQANAARMHLELQELLRQHQERPPGG